MKSNKLIYFSIFLLCLVFFGNIPISHILTVRNFNYNFTNTKQITLRNNTKNERNSSSIIYYSLTASSSASSTSSQNSQSSSGPNNSNNCANQAFSSSTSNGSPGSTYSNCICPPCVQSNPGAVDPATYPYCPEQTEQICSSANSSSTTTTPSSCSSSNSSTTDTNANQLYCSYILPSINILSISVGILTVLGIVIGSIQYIFYGGSPEQVSKAKKHIINSILALLAYAFLYAFLQFIIPGGLFQ